jgi:glycine/serine hydroxymethyltransferase
MSQLREKFDAVAFDPAAPTESLAATSRELCLFARQAIPQFFGTSKVTMLADDGWSFCEIGQLLERAAITCNKNGIPNDPLPPVKTSGIRVGSPAGTTRGFGAVEFREIGHMISDVLEGLRQKGEHGDPAVEAEVRLRVRELCSRFPIYPS